MRWLWLYICGYVIITLKGTDLESVISAASLAGVEFGQLRRILPDTICCRVSVADWRRLRGFIPKGRVRCTVIRRVGLPFWLQRMARRKALVVGGLLFLVMTYLLTSYVWFIQIRGYEDVDPGEILAAANRAGLTRGIRKDDLDQEAVTKHLLQEIPRLAWASLLVRGTMVTIEVAEKAVVDVSLQESGDMVASDGGIVLDVIPIKGSPQVASGDTVMKGQVLISGRLAPYEPEYWALDQAGRTPYLRADGIVNARVWYQETGLIPMVVEVREPTGNSERSTQVIIGSFVLGKATPSFEEYEVAVKSEYLQIRGWNLPLGRKEQVFNEIRVSRYELDYEDAKRIAKEKALESLKERLPEFGEENLRNVSYELITQDGVEYMEATVVVEVRKNIAEFAAVSAD